MNAVNYSSIESKESKILYFPSHSFHASEAKIELEVLDHLKNFGDVTVSLYWLDFLDPRIRFEIEARNCRVVCMGYRGSNMNEVPWANDGGRVNFMNELFNQISYHDAVVVDDISTVFFYAVLLGKNVGYTRKKSTWNSCRVNAGLSSEVEEHDNEEILSQWGMTKETLADNSQGDWAETP